MARSSHEPAFGRRFHFLKYQKINCMKFIVGTKQYMTQLFDKDGVVHPATAVAIPPVVVTQVKKTDTKDGYGAIQIGYGAKKHHSSKAVGGHVKEKGPFAGFKEFRTEGDEALNLGDTIAPSVFAEGEVVTVTATSKGKGFQGVVKRHGFSGGPRTHGQSHSEREPGSIGGGLRTRVPKGMRMAGRMGSDTVTVKNLKVLKIDSENAMIYLSGAVPGRKGTVVSIVSK
jgi:large subunit ribosomal protein L3